MQVVEVGDEIVTVGLDSECCRLRLQIGAVGLDALSAPPRRRSPEHQFDGDMGGVYGDDPPAALGESDGVPPGTAGDVERGPECHTPQCGSKQGRCAAVGGLRHPRVALIPAGDAIFIRPAHVYRPLAHEIS